MVQHIKSRVARMIIRRNRSNRFLLQDGDNGFESIIEIRSQLAFDTYAFCIAMDPPYDEHRVNEVASHFPRNLPLLPLRTDIGIILPRYEHPETHLLGQVPRFVNLHFMPKRIAKESIKSESQLVFYAACVVSPVTNARRIKEDM